MQKSKLIGSVIFLLCALQCVLLFSNDDEEETGVDLFSLLKFENGQCLEMEISADLNVCNAGEYLEDGTFELILESTILSLDGDGAPEQYRLEPKSVNVKMPGSERVHINSSDTRDNAMTIKFEDGAWSTYQANGDSEKDGLLHVFALPQSPELRALLPKRAVNPGDSWDLDFKSIEAYAKSLLKNEIDFDNGTDFHPDEWKGSGIFVSLKNGIATLKLSAEGSVQLEDLPQLLHISCTVDLEIDTQKGYLKTITGSFSGFVGEKEAGLQNSMFGIDCKATLNFRLLKK